MRVFQGEADAVDKMIFGGWVGIADRIDFSLLGVWVRLLVFLSFPGRSRTDILTAGLTVNELRKNVLLQDGY